ncbi:MAG: hypothetical protein MUD02_04765 [Bacteroidales bacterium]|jgi:hypothetical protein|nr:hypothetical protein [Bacteroidales bacterium]
MYRFFFRFAVTALTILTANLLTTAISDFLISYRNHYKPFTFTLIAMGIIIVVFYPLFMKLEDWVKAVSKKAIRTGKSMAGRNLGLAFTFILWLSVLFYFYIKSWYHIDLFKAIAGGDIGKYF